MSYQSLPELARRVREALDGNGDLPKAAAALADELALSDADAWENAWRDQYELIVAFEPLIDKATKGKSDAYKFALISYLIERLAEMMRMYLHLEPGDEDPRGH